MLVADVVHDRLHVVHLLGCFIEVDEFRRAERLIVKAVLVAPELEGGVPQRQFAGSLRTISVRDMAVLPF